MSAWLTWQALASGWLIVTGLLYVFMYREANKEPTAHGRDILVMMGCVGGLLWPFVVAYLVLFALPFWGLTTLFGKEKT